MQPISVSVLGTGVSNSFIFDIFQNPFNIGIGVVATGSLGTTNLSWAIEHCFDWSTVMSPTWNGTGGVTWFANSGLGANAGIGTSNLTANGNYAFPVAAIRLNVYSVGNATTSVAANFIQAVESP